MPIIMNKRNETEGETQTSTMMQKHNKSSQKTTVKRCQL